MLDVVAKKVEKSIGIASTHRVQEHALTIRLLGDQTYAERAKFLQHCNVAELASSEHAVFTASIGDSEVEASFVPYVDRVDTACRTTNVDG